MSEFKKKILTQFNNSVKGQKENTSYTCIGKAFSEGSIGDDNVKEIDEKVEKALPCWNCKRTYINFCLECPMLVHILDNDVREDIYSRAKRTLPKDILTVGPSCSTNQTFGIFTMLTIPEGVNFGPCEGLHFIEKDSGCAFQMKHGRFVKHNKRACSNWMIYINCVAKESDGNLIMYQKNYDLYFRNRRTIQKGEELILYYNPDNLIYSDQDEQEFYYPAEEETKKKRVFACTYCCLGFNLEIYLRDHKTICPYITAADIEPVKAIVQCAFCLIYLEEEEYRGFHMTCCCEKHSRRCALLEKLNIPSTLAARKIMEKNVEEKYPIPLETTYTCSVCNYTSSFCQNFRTHSCSNSPRARPSKSPSKCATENELTKCARRDKDGAQKSITVRQNDAVSIESDKNKKCVNKTNDDTRSILTSDRLRVKVEQCDDRAAEKSKILKRIDVTTVNNSNNAGSDGTMRKAGRKAKRRRTRGTIRSAEQDDVADKDCIVISDDNEDEVKVKNLDSEKPISPNHKHHNSVLQDEKCRKDAPVKNKSATNFQSRPLLAGDSFESYQNSFEYYLRKYRESSTAKSSKQTSRATGFTLVKVFDVDDLNMTAKTNVRENREKSANSDEHSRKKHISQYADCGKKPVDEESAVRLRSCGTKNGHREGCHCEKFNSRTCPTQSFQTHKNRIHGIREGVPEQKRKHIRNANGVRRNESPSEIGRGRARLRSQTKGRAFRPYAKHQGKTLKI